MALVVAVNGLTVFRLAVLVDIAGTGKVGLAFSLLPPVLVRIRGTPSGVLH